MEHINKALKQKLLRNNVRLILVNSGIKKATKGKQFEKEDA